LKIFSLDGKGVRKIVKELVDDGYLLLHKVGQTVSLNPVRKGEIIEYIERVVEFRKS